MPITHPALQQQPEQWRYTLADGHQIVSERVPDLGAPLLCHHPSHGDAAELGVMQSIIRVEQVRYR